jgi:hypothetical protein
MSAARGEKKSGWIEEVSTRNPRSCGPQEVRAFKGRNKANAKRTIPGHVTLCYGRSSSGPTTLPSFKQIRLSFRKLMLNFTWWVDRKDRFGKNVFEVVFLDWTTSAFLTAARPWGRIADLNILFYSLNSATRPSNDARWMAHRSSWEERRARTTRSAPDASATLEAVQEERRYPPFARLVIHSDRGREPEES